MKKFLILGFGRMGITHLAHINGELAGHCHFDIFDPSWHFKLASYFNVRKNIKFVRHIPDTKYDGILITSPPKFHSINFRDTLHLSDNFFIEKPLTLSADDIALARTHKKHIYCGYVLRKNPCIQYLQNLSQGANNLSVNVEVLSNLGQDETDDWRFDIKKGGGCINELGSHAINLALCFADMKETDEAKNKVRDVHHIDVGTFSVDLNSNNPVKVHGDWNTTVRKTVYKLTIKNERMNITTDLQNVYGEIDGKQVSWSPREDSLSVGFYVRGIDFALQSQLWLRQEISTKDLTDSVFTDDILSEVVTHA